MKANTSTRDAAFVDEMVSRLSGRNDGDIGTFFNQTMWLVDRYATGYELDGPLYLVLDNSLIQDFKHQQNNAKRALRALAFTAFCRFVSGWSDRPTYLAISPVAIYEHLGRPQVTSTGAAWAAMSELQRLLNDTGLLVYTIGFQNPHELAQVLRKVEADAQFLTRYVQEIDSAVWQLDLKTPIGVRIPMSIAFEAIPDDLPLQYFDPWYVKFTFASRIEQLIIEQSQHNPEAKPIGSGELMEALADLNEIKRGVLKGIEDIELLQICDVQRQFKQRAGYVLLGQTFDRGLARVLTQRHQYQVGAGVVVGEPNTEERIAEMVSLMVSNPFKQQEARAAQIRSKLREFLETLIAACEAAQKARAKVQGGDHGRDIPRWAQASRATIPNTFVDTQLVGHLSATDAATYLERAGIVEPAMRDRLVHYTQVAPGQSHPFYLGLCTDVVLASITRGVPLTPQDFHTAPQLEARTAELLDRLLRYVDVHVESAVRALSACRAFDWEIYLALGTALHFQATPAAFEVLCRFSFVWRAETSAEGWYRIHDFVRRIMHERPAKGIHQAHEVLEHYYRAKAATGDTAAGAEAIYHANHLDWARGVQEWCEVFKTALDHSDYEHCRVLLAVRNVLTVGTEMKLGEVSLCEGDYFFYLAQYEKARQEFTEAITAYDRALEQAPDND
jgi:hypothetical protein